MITMGELFDYIASGDLDALKIGVQHVTDPQSLYDLLDEAVDQDNLDALELILACGADVNGECEIKKTDAFWSAATAGSLKAAKWLLTNGCRIKTDTLRHNPLVAAVGQGDLDFCIWLIDAGCDPHACYELRGGTYRNALSYAIDCGHQEIADYLARLGCKVPETEESVSSESTGPKEWDDKYESGLVSHMSEFLGSTDGLAAYEVIPTPSQVSVAVHFSPASESGRHLSLFSVGPGLVALSPPEGKAGYEHVEYVMHLPEAWPHPRTSSVEWAWPVSYFKQVAYKAHLQDQWLGRGIVVNVGADDSWPVSSDLAQALLLPDLIPGLEFEGRKIHFYTIVPMDKKAIKLGARKGVEGIAEAIKTGKLEVDAVWRQFL